MKKVYIGGSLFKQGDIKQRLYEEDYVNKASNNTIEVFNPINGNCNDKASLPTATDIFKEDFKHIESSDYMLAALDDYDVGLSTEIGICFGMNYVRDKFQKLYDSGNVTKESLKELLDSIKPKKIYAHISDIRKSTAHNYTNENIPFGYNQFVIGTIKEIGSFHHTAEEAIEEMVKDNK